MAPARATRLMLAGVAAAAILSCVTGVAAAQSLAPSRTTRLFLGATGRALPAGEGYFILHGAVVPSFQVGVTDRFSVGGGTFFFAGGSFFVTPKVQIARRGRTSVAASVLHFIVPGEGSVGLAFVAATRDTTLGGLTIGAGAAYTSGWDEDADWAVGGPLILLGAERQLGRRVAFVSENYLVIGGDEFGGLLFNGIRATWGRFALDVAAMVTATPDGAFGAPFLNLAWRF